MCNSVPDDRIYGESIGNSTDTISNWSVAEEVKRLITINSVVPLEPEYIFHKEGCSSIDKTPITDEKSFSKRGKSSTNSQKYQCKECKKITSVLPGQEQSFNYHQQRNDILIEFTKDILSRTPVKRIIEKLEIGSSTYYNKLEWVYRKCLEFNERYETKVLNNLELDEIWINTDMMIYNLNNIWLNGKAGKKDEFITAKDKKLQTYLLSSADLKSGYVFRTDIAYDYDIRLEDVEKDTGTYHCDHSYPFLRKNDRLKYPYCPQPPTEKDDQSSDEYIEDLFRFNGRKDYVEGSHVKPQYTAMAHYFLLKRAIKAKNWYFVSDDDSTLQHCIFKVFSKTFKDGYTFYFTCQSEKKFTFGEAGREAYNSRQELYKWGRENSIRPRKLYEYGKQRILQELKTHKFYGIKKVNGINCPIRGKNPIKHPLPDNDEGIRWVNLINHVPYIEESVLADLVMQVNSRAINNFFQQVRRRISILERPLITARGDGRSYIYANYNPKYAHQMMVIFRTFYNFCFTSKVNKISATPAQRLGLTDKVYDYKDIIYFR
ncbi:MAG TPA: insertion element protein [Clostridiaceae bacterium]